MTVRVPRWLPVVAAWACVLATVAYSVTERWAVLGASPFPLGVDGYFYPVQLRALLQTGHLAYPASPLAFYLLAPFAAATDPVTGAKVGAAVLCALIAVPAYVVGVQLSRQRAVGVLVAVLAGRSAGSAYCSIEFVKNGIGLTVAVAALAAVLGCLRTPTRARVTGALVAVVAAVLTHKMAAAIVVAIAVPATLSELAGRGILRGRRLLYAVSALALAAIAMVLLGAAAPERFLSPADLALVAGMVTRTPHFELPALLVPRHMLGYEPLLCGLVTLVAAVGLLAERQTRGGRIAGVLVAPVHRFGLVLAARLAPASAAGDAASGDTAPPAPASGAPTSTSATRRTVRELHPLPSSGLRMAAWCILGFGALIALPWLAVDDPDGLGFRIRVAAFVPMALATAIALRTWLVAVPAPIRATAVSVLVVLATLHTPGTRTEGRVLMHPALISAVTALPSHVPPGAVVVIPERHLLFLAAWYTHLDLRLRPDGIPPARLVRALPLGGFIVAGSPLDAALIAARGEPSIPPPVGLHARHPNGFVLVTDATWHWLLDRVGRDDPRARRYWAAWPTR